MNDVEPNRLFAILVLMAFAIAMLLMAADKYGVRKHELEMAKSGFVRDGNKWVKAEGGCK